MLQLILTLMLLLNRRRSDNDLHEVATAISQVATTPTEARVLVTIHFNESGFNPRHRTPFGVMSKRGSTDLVEAGRRSLRIWSNGLRTCRTPERAFRYYITGRCNERISDLGQYGNARTYMMIYARIGGPRPLASLRH
jgi:hypothetical protein